MVPSGFPGGSVIKNPPAVQETEIQSLGWTNPLEKQRTAHSSVLAWEISPLGTEEKLESGGSWVAVRGETRRLGRGDKRGCFAGFVW